MKELKKAKYTILCPQMSPIHFELFESAVNASGYSFKVLKECKSNWGCQEESCPASANLW